MRKQTTAESQSSGLSRSVIFAGTVFFTGALILCMTLGSAVPFLPWLWTFVPNLALLGIGFLTAALFGPSRTRIGLRAGAVVFALVGVGGALIRYESTLKWAALAEQDVISIERRVQVSLLESINVTSNVEYLLFSPALYDSIELSCRDPHCFTFSGFARAFKWTEEAMGSAIAATKLSIAGADSLVRVTLEVEQSSLDGVVTIQASLRDAQGEFATMRILRPDPDRDWSPQLPKLLYLAFISG